MKNYIYQLSRQGGRRYNEDAVAYTYSPGALLMVVADGMGGHQRGEVASQTAVRVIRDLFQEWAQPVLPDVENFLLSGIYAAHEAINRYAAEQGMADPPHTTCVVCVVQKGYAWWAHVGDSRLYRFDRSGPRFHTRDHSVAQQLVDSGQVTEAQARLLPERNMLYQSVGGIDLPEVELSPPARLEEGGVLLLCSDGFWSDLGAREMHAELQARPLKQALNRLMDLAEARAGEDGDNLSALAFRFGAEPA